MYARGGDKFPADHAARRCHHPYSANRTTNKKAGRVRGPLASSCAYVGAKKNSAPHPTCPTATKGRVTQGMAPHCTCIRNRLSLSNRRKTNCERRVGGGGACALYANTRMRRIRTAISKLAPQMTHTSGRQQQGQEKKTTRRGEIHTMRQHDTKKRRHHAKITTAPHYVRPGVPPPRRRKLSRPARACRPSLPPC